MHMCICNIYIYIHVYICIYLYIHRWYVCMHSCMYVGMYVCMHACMCICVCVYVCICVYVYIYTYYIWGRGWLSGSRMPSKRKGLLSKAYICHLPWNRRSIEWQARGTHTQTYTYAYRGPGFLSLSISNTSCYSGTTQTRPTPATPCLINLNSTVLNVNTY